MKQAGSLALCAIAVVLAGAVLLGAKIKIEVKHDKTFNFAGLKTYTWRLDGANPVKILQNTEHDPEQIRKNLEPVVLDAFDTQLAAKGLRRVAAGESELFIDYYVLIGPNITSQYHGQFVGAIPEWGLPDFVMSTSALKIYEQGSVVVDIGSVKDKIVAWRGYAAAELDSRRTRAQQVAIINDVAKKMLAKFPPKYEPAAK
jgi:hypothetical protein